MPMIPEKFSKWPTMRFEMLKDFKICCGNDMSNLLFKRIVSFF